MIDGCPPGVALDLAALQAECDRRKPGQSRFVTQRREEDLVEVLSGVFEDDGTDGLRTTGTPISLMIRNTDQRSKDYGEIRDKFRPGHADFTYDAKYGIRDYRGGGRSSARETAARVAAGAVAKQVLNALVPGGVTIRAALVQIGREAIDRLNWDWSEVGRNPFFSPDPDSVARFEAYLDGIRKAGSSIGAILEVVAEGAELTGEENADEIRMGNDGPIFQSNNAGGILGGISSGQPIVARLVVKPTSSILTPRKTIDRTGHDTDLITKGRHDPCVGIRAVPVVEAMTAITLVDHALRHRGQTGR